MALLLFLIVALVLALALIAWLIVLLLRRRELPPYVSLPGSMSYPQPFLQQNCSMAVLALQADFDTLRGTVDRWLNVPVNRTYRYVPLFPAVFVASLAIRRMVMKDPPESQWGFMTENDLCVGFPLIALRDSIPSHFAYAFAYLGVDQGPSLYSGRENFGFRKVLMTMELDPVLRCAVAGRTQSIARYRPNAPLVWDEVIRIHPPGNLPAERRSMFTDGLQLVQAVLNLLPDHSHWLARAGARGVCDLVKLLQPSFPAAYLKQIRDIEDPQNACYQAVVEDRMTFTAFREGGMLDSGFRVTLADYDSYPIISDLGVVPDFGTIGYGQQQTFTAMFGFWADFDFEAGNGRVIGERGANRRLWW